MDGKLIAEKRKEKGLTQDALGAMLGISRKAVSKWERGLSQPDEAHMVQLINLLGLPVEQEMVESEPTPTFLSIVRNELFRILSVGVMIAVCACDLMGTIPEDSTAVSIGLSAAVYCFDTMIRNQ